MNSNEVNIGNAVGSVSGTDALSKKFGLIRPLDISFEGSIVGIAISPEDEQVDEES